MTKKPDDVLVLSVKLKSGRFETTLQVPFPCSVEEGRAAMDKWFEMALFGLRTGVQEMEAVFKEQAPDAG